MDGEDECRSRNCTWSKTAERLIVVSPLDAISGIEACTADVRPSFDGTPVASLPVSVVGFQGEAGLDDEMHGGLVLKGDVNAVVFARGEEFESRALPLANRLVVG